MARVNRAVTRKLGLVFAALFLLAGVAAGSQEREQNDDKLIEQLESLDESTKEIEDLSAAFSQTRVSPLLRKPIESSGTFRSVPGLTRWDTDKPYSAVMLVKPDRLELYDPERETLEVYPVERRLGELLANPHPDLKDWRKHFWIQRGKSEMLSESMRERCGIDDQPKAVLLIRLLPREKIIREVVAELVVVLDVELGLSRGMAWSTGEEERTEIVFDAIRVNSGLKAEQLKLKLPESVRISYPLGPVPQKKNK